MDSFQLSEGGSTPRPWIFFNATEFSQNMRKKRHCQWLLLISVIRNCTDSLSSIKFSIDNFLSAEGKPIKNPGFSNELELYLAKSIKKCHFQISITWFKLNIVEYNKLEIFHQKQKDIC